MVHFLAAAVVASSFAVMPEQANWQADYGKALAATRSDQRPLLVVLDIPSNPQASLSGELLAAQGEQAKLLEAYELCHVDVSTAYGKQVAEAFKATQFPHTAIIDRTGAVVLFKKPGQIGATEWNATLAKYQSGVQPVSQTSFYRGGSVMPTSYPAMSNGSYCPSCQRAAMGL
ncbi:MAG TPA: hypothetical protein VEQ85_02165 [Lacipirellulaceae bacterium]|nr:hypothetical protein [Lacipirellulaceae bacterium]